MNNQLDYTIAVDRSQRLQQQAENFRQAQAAQAQEDAPRRTAVVAAAVGRKLVNLGERLQESAATPKPELRHAR